MYHLNIIGNGRVTLSLLKVIFDKQLDKYIEKVTVWSREHKSVNADKLITQEDSINEDIVRIHLMQKAVGKKLNRMEDKVEFKTFACLDDLVSINNSNRLNLLILTVKYDLDEIVYLDKARRKKINLNYPGHLELLMSRMKVLMPGKGNYDALRGEERRRKLLFDVNQILGERRLVKRAINELSKNISAGYTRLYNLEHSAVGVKYLAQALRNYHGIIFNMINEVDTTNWILHRVADLKPDIILTPCENDTIRAKYFLRRNLKSKGINAKEILLDYIGPHNHSGFIPVETVKVNGKLLTEITENKTALAIIEEVTKEVNGFGEDVFLKKGSSDEDTVLGICATLSSVFRNSTSSVVRLSCYDEKYQLYSGLPGFFRGMQFCPVKDTVSGLSQESRDRLLRANDEQKVINRSIMSAIQNLGNQPGILHRQS